MEEDLKKKLEECPASAKSDLASAGKQKKEIDELKKKLEDCLRRQDEYLAGWQRARADFLNYKKEEMERIGAIIQFANADFILRILPILDNFEKAEKETPEDKKKDKFLEGLLQIQIQLRDFLKNQGVEEIKTLGEKFDPNFHEVVEQVEGEESGKIVEVIQKGYTIQDRIIRPAKVKIIK